MKKIIYIMMFALVGLLTSCGNNNSEATHDKMLAKYKMKSQDELMKLATQEDMYALYYLAVNADNPLSRDKAFRYYLQSAKQGLPEAMNVVGNRLRDGDGVEQDIQEAIKWHKKAMENGSLTGTFNLAQYYAFGNGVQKDSNKAIELAKKCFDDERIVPNVYTLLGKIYISENNASEGLENLKKGADLDCAEAQRILGGLYLVGELVPQDEDKGINLLRLAYRNGDEKAREIMEQFGIRPI